MMSKTSKDIIKKMATPPKEKEIKPLPKKKSVIEKPKKEIDKITPFETLFPEIHIIESERYDINYISIRRKIISTGQYLGLIKSKRKIMNDNEAAIEHERKLIAENNSITLWEFYCLWFNARFNNGKER